MCNPSSSPLLNILFELLCFCFHTYSLFIGYQTQMCERLRWLNLVCQVKKIHPNIRRKTTARAFILESLRSALSFSLKMPHFKKLRLVLHPQLCLCLWNRMEQDAKWTVTAATDEGHQWTATEGSEFRTVWSTGLVPLSDRRSEQHWGKFREKATGQPPRGLHWMLTGSCPWIWMNFPRDRPSPGACHHLFLWSMK